MDQKQVLKNGIIYENNSLNQVFDSFLELESLTSRMVEKLEERLPLISECKLFQEEVRKKETGSIKTIRIDMRKIRDLFSCRDYVDILSEAWKEQPDVVDCARTVLEKHGKKETLELTGLLVSSIANNPLCYRALDEIYYENAEMYNRKREEAKRYGACFFAHFGVEEVVYARYMAGILEYLRTGEGRETEAVYNQVSRMIFKGWPEIYRALKKKTKISYEYTYQLMREKEGFRKQRKEVPSSRLCMTNVIIELLEIEKEGSFWFLLNLEALFHVEQSLWKKDNQEIDGKECGEIRKKIEKRVPEIHQLVPVTEACIQYDRHKVDQLRNLFRIGGLELDALYQIELSSSEVERILHYGEISGEEKLTDYLYYMSIVSLCKYITHCKSILAQRIEQEEIYRRKEQKERQEQSHKNKENEEKTCIDEVKRYLQYYKEETYRLNSVIMESQRQYEKGKKKAISEKEQWERERQELIALRNFVYQLQQEEEEYPSEEDKTLETLKNSSVLVFGGHDSWQNKMRKKFPGWKFISGDQQTFDLRFMDRYQYLVINTNMFKHGIYYKIMSEKDQLQKIVYVNGNNISRCIRQLAGQIC